MKKIFLMLNILIFISVVIISCGGKEESKESLTEQEKIEQSYGMMHTAFEGNPEIEEFKPMLDDVMTTYGYEINEKNLNAVGSALLELKKASKVGVTEMEILKHIYQKGTDKISFADQAGLSAATLELTK
jgi:hypothetical protein